MEEGRPLTSEALKGREKGRGRRPGLTFKCQCVHLLLVLPFLLFGFSSLHLSILLIVYYVAMAMSNEVCVLSLLTDSAVRSGETWSALAPKPVDSVHTDAAVVTERGKK